MGHIAAVSNRALFACRTIALQLPAAVKRYTGFWPVPSISHDRRVHCLAVGGSLPRKPVWCATVARGPTGCGKRACRLALLDTVARTHRTSDRWAGQHQVKLWV